MIQEQEVFSTLTLRTILLETNVYTMTSVIKRLRVHMPDYMYKNVLGYVCKSKQQAIFNELVHYVHTQQYLHADKKELIRSLLDEVVPSTSQSFSLNMLKQMVFCKPKHINLTLKRTSRSGVSIFIDILYPDSETVIGLRIVKKRSIDKSITISRPITPGAGVITMFSDISMSRSGDRSGDHNEQYDLFESIILGHLSPDMRALIVHLLQNNRWTTMKQAIGLLLTAKKGLTRTNVIVNFKADTGKVIRLTHIV